MLLSLLFLIILAVMAYQSKKIILSAVVFAALKAIASCFYCMSESDLGFGTAAALAVSQFAASFLLGWAIAYLVVKKSQDWKFTFVTMTLCVATFLTSLLEPLALS